MSAHSISHKKVVKKGFVSYAVRALFLEIGDRNRYTLGKNGLTYRWFLKVFVLDFHPRTFGSTA